MSSTLGTWRDEITGRLTSQVPQATTTATADKDATIAANNWESPSLFVEFESGAAGENLIIGGVLQEIEALVNVYVAVRGGEIASNSDILELAEEKASTGVLDLVDSVIEALLGFELSGAGAPHLILEPTPWDQYATAEMIVVYVVRFRVKGSSVQSIT
jgi:hypothetical protein